MHIHKTLAAAIAVSMIFSLVSHTPAKAASLPGTGSAFNETLSQQPSVDLALSDTSLTLPSATMPGYSVTLKARVYNQSQAEARPGGGTVRFLVNGTAVDEVPFYLSPGQAYMDVRAFYMIPEGPYRSMERGDEVPMTVTAIIDPENLIAETDEGNNTASREIRIQYVYDSPVKEVDPFLTVDASGLSATSKKSDAPGGRINAAQPGQRLTLKAEMPFSNEAGHAEDINVKFLVDGQIVLDENRTDKYSRSGEIKVECDYFVPFSRTEPLDFQVVLSNGASAAITVPVLRYDIGLLPGDIYSVNSNPIVPGGEAYLRATLRNLSSVAFPYDEASIAWRALINGETVAEGKYRPAAYDETYISIPSFTIPEDQTEPIVVTVLTDAYNQLSESDETNNAVTIEIPTVVTEVLGTNFYIPEGGLSYANYVTDTSSGTVEHLIQPGTVVPLQACVYAQGNGLTALAGQSLAVRFLINGTAVRTESVPCRQLNDIFGHTVSYDWSVPEDIVGHVDFTVVLDPCENGSDGAFAEVNEDDNTASLSIPLLKPDLDVSQSEAACTEANPVTGRETALRALVRNSSVAKALHGTVGFLVDGQNVGTARVDHLNGSTSVYVSIPWTPEVPPGEEPYAELAGAPGFLALPEYMTRDFVVKVVADPDNALAESCETNNLSPETTVTAIIPTQKKVVYASVAEDIYGSVPGVEVTLTDKDGRTAAATTNGAGCCTFTGVPAGEYRLSAIKEGYHTLEASTRFTVGQDATCDYPSITMVRDAQFVSIATDDRDHDLLSDTLEAYYGTDPDNMDSDGDGVIDGKDLSPTVFPDAVSKASFTNIQEPGMVRFRQNIVAYGLDGWVDVYDLPYVYGGPEFNHTEEDDGTKYSIMSGAAIAHAINKYYGPDYALTGYADIVPADIAYGAEERTHDHTAETGCVITHGHTRYDFHYDYLTDYVAANLMNITPVTYSLSNTTLFYKMFPVQLASGKQNTFKFQLRNGEVAGWLREAEAAGGSASLYFQYEFLYQGTESGEQSWIPLYSGMAEANFNSNDLYEGRSLIDFSVSIPEGAADRTGVYLKITPLLAVSKGGSTQWKPALFDWYMSGLQREVVYYNEPSGRSLTVRENVKSLAGLDAAILSPETVRSANMADPASYTKMEYVLAYSPAAPANEKVTTLETVVKAFTLAGDTIGHTDSAIEFCEKSAQIIHKASCVENLPADSIFRSAKYSALTDGLELAGDVVAICTDGLEAYKAYRNGDSVECVYYAAKTTYDAAETAHDVAKLVMVSKNTVATAEASGRMTWLFSARTTAALAIAAGMIELGYNVYKLNDTDDPFEKAACEERIGSTLIDTSLAVASAAFPPLGAALITWKLEREAFGLIFGKGFAYRVAESPGTAFITITELATDTILSEDMQTSYNAARADLIALIESINDMGEPYYPFTAVFVDPEDN